MPRTKLPRPGGVKENIVSSLSIAYLSTITLLTTLPIVWMISGAFKSSNELVSGTPSLIPENCSIDAFRSLMSTGFLRYLRNSTIVAVCTSVSTTIVASISAFCLSKSSQKLAKPVMTVSLLAYSMAPVMLVIPYALIVSKLELTNSLAGVILCHSAFCFPFALWILKSVFDTVPTKIKSQSLIDGLSPFRSFLRVVIRLALPGVLSTFIFVFVLSWNEYVIARIILGSESLKTLTIGIEDLFGNNVAWNQIMALGSVMLLPSIALAGAVYVSIRNSTVRMYKE